MIRRIIEINEESVMDVAFVQMPAMKVQLAWLMVKLSFFVKIIVMV